MPWANGANVPSCRRIIGGVAYDTTTASLQFHSWSEEYPVGSMLFLNKWDKYFKLDYNYMMDDPEGITPLSEREAIAWAEQHCPHLVEQLFGQMPEAGEGEPYQRVEPER